MDLRVVLDVSLSRAILPPAGLILAVLGSIFFGIATPTEAAGVVPFIALQVTGGALIFLWPELVTWLPARAYG